jgi:hypothetical protein
VFVCRLVFRDSRVWILTDISVASSKDLPALHQLGVTISGVHVMAYLGNRQWIEADPDIGKVVIVQVPERTNPWFQETFKLLRWRELDVEQHATETSRKGFSALRVW